jgi:archaellum component FlaG (FlaF/FlaG flagellin family)
MKKAVLSLSLILAFVFVSKAQDVAPKSKAEIEFVNDVHDFGNLMQNGDATTEFVFKNTGTEPLIISNAKGSCGCTVPSWPKEPIMPGKTGSIKVKYDSKRVGPINKSVTISSNASNEAEKVLRIKGNIEALPEGELTPVKETPAGAPVEGK